MVGPQYWVSPSEEGRAALADVVRAADGYEPGVEVSSLTFWANPEGPVRASIGGGRTLYLDPSTAEVRGENTTGVRSLLGTVRGWHRWFNITGEGRANARAITGWSNLVFLFLVGSGLYLWFPKRWSWQHIRPILVLNTKAEGKARDFNWHNVFGFWMAIPLALVVASATVISFPWASDLAYRIAGDSPPERRSAVRAPPSGLPGAGEVADTEGESPEFDLAVLDPLLERAMTREEGWRTISVSLPDEPTESVAFRLDRGWGGAPQLRTTLTLDARDGSELSYAQFADQGRGSRFRSFLRFVHTGEFFGIAGQTLAGIASLAGVLLVWSGFALAWRRLVRPIVRRRRSYTG